MAVHQRGRGQLATTCQGGPAPLGFTRPWDNVTCFACKFYPLVAAFREMTAVLQRFVDAFGVKR